MLRKNPAAATGDAEIGELVNIVSQVKDLDNEGWYRTWNTTAMKSRATGDEFAPAGRWRSPHHRRAGDE